MQQPTIRHNLRALASELRALAAGHWRLLGQEMSGKASRSRSELIRMAAGILAALTAVQLLLAGLTLLLAQLLAGPAGLPPLLSAGVAALISTAVFALTGWLVFRQSGAQLKKETLAPHQTIASLRATARALTDQPLLPGTAPVPNLNTYPNPNPNPNPTPNTAMNSRHNFQDTLHHTADTVEQQARRAGRAVQDTARSLSQKFDPGAFFTEALAWFDAVMTPQNRALAGRALAAASVIPRRHPALAAVLGLGAAYALWRKSNPSGPETMRDYAEDTAATVREAASRAKSSASNGFQAAAAAGRDVRDALYEGASRVAENGRHAASRFSSAAAATAQAVRDTCEHTRENLHASVDHLTEAARHLREDAEAGYEKAKTFVKEEPALAIAGGVALAIGAALLIRSARR